MTRIQIAFLLTAGVVVGAAFGQEAPASAQVPRSMVCEKMGQSADAIAKNTAEFGTQQLAAGRTNFFWPGNGQMAWSVVCAW
jgi:hypothetical protein